MQSSKITTPIITTANAPIGVFDSGVGGLSVVNELIKKLPHEHIIYLADTKNVPYGHRLDDNIIQLSANGVHWLVQQGCKAIIMACNTASAFSLTPLRERYGQQLPIFGLVPAVKPAALQSKTGVIGVLATPGTLRGNLLTEVIAAFATPMHVKVITAVSQALVPLIELGEINSESCATELRHALAPVIAAGADQLVLGCTHYPFLKPMIHQLFPDQLNLLDSGAAVAQHCANQLQQLQRLNILGGERILKAYVTGDITRAQLVIPQLCFEVDSIDWVELEAIR